MNMKLRTKHKILRTSWLILTLLLVGLMVFLMLPTENLSNVLLSTYLVAVIMFVVYEIVLLHELYGEKKKDVFLLRNSWIQLYIGLLSLFTATISFIVSVIFTLKVETSLFLFIGLTLLFLFASFNYVEKLIETYLHKRSS
jgi:hypothetical protein